MQTKTRFIKPLAILILASTIGFASQAQQKNESRTSMQVTVDQPDSTVLKFTMFVTNPENKKVNITVSQKNNDVLHSEFFTGNKYAAKYDMSQLGDGDYIIEISNGKERVMKDISIQTVVAVNRIAYLQKGNNREKVKPLAF